jgi:hypothetical protein
MLIHSLKRFCPSKHLYYLMSPSPSDAVAGIEVRIALPCFSFKRDTLTSSLNEFHLKMH